MDGLLLDRDEFLVLLNATGAQGVIGLNQDELFPASIDDLRRSVEVGQRKLAARGLLQQAPDGVFELSELVLMIATVVAAPDLAVISMRDVPKRGRQLLLHYLVGDFVVEQTLPAEGQHRLATLPNRAALVSRLVEFFSIKTSLPHETQTQLPEADFNALVAEAITDRSAVFERLISAGVTAETAALLVETLVEPLLRGTVALLRIREATISDGRNPALAIGLRAAWAFFQTVPGEPRVTLMTIDANRLGTLLAGWLAELSAEPTS